MSDDLADFFEENTHWVDSKGNTTSVKPPKPPKSRREMRRRRNVRRRKTIIVLTMVVAVLVVVIAGGFFGVRALRAIRDRNDGGHLLRRRMTAVRDTVVEFTVSQGESPSSIAKRLVEAEVVKSADAFTGVSSGMTLYPDAYQLRKHMPRRPWRRSCPIRARRRASSTSTRGSGCPTSSRRPRRSARSTNPNSRRESSTPKAREYCPGKPAATSRDGWNPASTTSRDSAPRRRILKTIVDKRVSKLNEMHVPTGNERQRLLIIASIAEAEVNSSDYYGKVTRVILNRLDRDMTLGMDSTTAYGLGINGTQLTNAQLNDSSNKYNTRVNKDSPPRPSAIRETAPSRRR